MKKEHKGWELSIRTTIYQNRLFYVLVATDKNGRQFRYYKTFQNQDIKALMQSVISDPQWNPIGNTNWWEIEPVKGSKEHRHHFGGIDNGR